MCVRAREGRAYWICNDNRKLATWFKRRLCVRALRPRPKLVMVIWHLHNVHMLRHVHTDSNYRYMYSVHPPHPPRAGHATTLPRQRDHVIWPKIVVDFIMATTSRHRGLNMFSKFFGYWSSNMFSRCRFREENKNCRVPSSAGQVTGEMFISSPGKRKQSTHIPK